MLTRGRIVEAGLRILDAWGLGDLTMRRVADELGVKAGALYYHMPNKQSLLAEIADVILTPVAVPRATDTGEWLVSSAAALGMGAVDVTLAARELLAGNGYPEPAATMATFLHFILGHVMAEQTRVQLATLGVLEGFDEHASRTDFSHGVELLVRGVTTSQQPEDFPSRSQ